MDEQRIPWSVEEFTPEVVAGIMPDGLNEYMHPDYPDLPYPDAINNVTWYKDPLITNDEPAAWGHYWEPEDPEHPWNIPYGPHYPPID